MADCTHLHRRAARSAGGAHRQLLMAPTIVKCLAADRFTLTPAAAELANGLAGCATASRCKGQSLQAAVHGAAGCVDTAPIADALCAFFRLVGQHN